MTLKERSFIAAAAIILCVTNVSSKTALDTITDSVLFNEFEKLLNGPGNAGDAMKRRITTLQTDVAITLLLPTDDAVANYLAGGPANEDKWNGYTIESLNQLISDPGTPVFNNPSGFQFTANVVTYLSDSGEYFANDAALLMNEALDIDGGGRIIPTANIIFSTDIPAYSGIRTDPPGASRFADLVDMAGFTTASNPVADSSSVWIQRPRTVFLPTNAALQALENVDGVNKWTELLDGSDNAFKQEVVNAHFVEGHAFFLNSFKTLSNETFNSVGDKAANVSVGFANGEARVSAGGISAKIVSSRLHQSNTIIHTIDRLLVYRAYTAFELIQKESPSFAERMQQVLNESVIDRLNTSSNAQPLTVFIPSEKVVQTAMTLDAWRDDTVMRKVMLDHIISTREVTPQTLSSVPSLQVDDAERTWRFSQVAEDWYVKLGQSAAPINPSVQSEAVRNGVAYLISDVLSLTTPTPWTQEGYFGDFPSVSSFAADFQRLYMAQLEEDGTDEPALPAGAPIPLKFYIMAPTNAQMNALKLSDVGQKLFADAKAAKRFMARHVVRVLPEWSGLSTMGAGENELVTYAYQTLVVNKPADSETIQVKYEGRTASVLLSDARVGHAFINVIDEPLTTCTLPAATTACFGLPPAPVDSGAVASRFLTVNLYLSFCLAFAALFLTTACRLR